MAEISELWVYPVKSLPGISLQRVEVGARGLKLDRHWMLIDADGRFITQREEPSLVRFRVKLKGDGLEVWEPEHGCCAIPSTAEGDKVQTHVWKSDMEARLVHPDIDAWFTRALGRECRLVVMPDDSDRKVNPEFGDFPLGFSDAMPVLVLSEASLADLNTRLFEPVPANRFRANILLRGVRAYEEDATERLLAGEVNLVSTKRCGRCMMTCIDQETGERGVEPLTSLAQYRIFGQNACMGMYFAPETFGALEVRQRVELEPSTTRSNSLALG